MRRLQLKNRRGLIAFLAMLMISLFGEETFAKDSPPNILIILADDMGYSDLGCYGGEISTPNIDALAANGLRYSQFYNTARCWPTRAALLTGYYAQQVNRDDLPGQPRSGQRPAWARLLPELIASRGYHSYHAGKWHVDGNPLDNGFERSYVLNDHNRFFTANDHVLDGKNLPAAKVEDDYYATSAIADYAIEFLQHHESEHPDEPFFEYVAFTSPHFPLHAPADDIARYADRYHIGWDKVRAARWDRLQKMQTLAGKLSALEPKIGPPYDFPKAIKQFGPGEVNRELPWDSLSTQQQEFQAAKMAVHAAMVDRMDQEVGRIIEQLRQTGRLENTVIFVLSDNGASAEIMVRGDGHDPEAPPGSADTFLCLGPGWSSAANTPFRRHKTWVHEGGTATSFIVHWPAGLSVKGEWRQAVGHVIDIVPTVLDLVGQSSNSLHKSEGAPTPPGRSLAPTFAHDVNDQPRTLWWLHTGNRALRVGDWKLVAAKGEPWELYKMDTDRTEMQDLASGFPDRVEEMAQIWENQTAEFLQLTKNNAVEDAAK